MYRVEEPHLCLKTRIGQDYVCTDSNFAMNKWILKPPGTYLNTDKTKCCEEKSNLYPKGVFRLRDQRLKLVNHNVCPDSIFTMNGNLSKIV